MGAVRGTSSESPYDEDIAIGLKSSKDVVVEYLVHFQYRKFGGRNWKNAEIKLPADTREKASHHFKEWKSKMNPEYQRNPKLFEKRTELIFLTE